MRYLLPFKFSKVMDKTILLQQQIKENAYGLQDYVSDLEKWEKRIDHKDKALKKRQKNAPTPIAAPRNPSKSTTSQSVQNTPPTNEDPNSVIHEKYKRDVAPMKDYYKAWDNFDIDGELSKLEEDKQSSAPKPPPQRESQKDTPTAPIRSKVIIKGGRGQNSELDRIKDEGNLAFSSHDFSKAVERYTTALTMTPTSELEVILLSNRAQAYLKMHQGPQAESDCQQALVKDPNHLKTYNRLQQAQRLQQLYRDAAETISKALAISPADKFFLNEQRKVANIQGKRRQDILDIMTNPHRVPVHPLTSLTVEDVNAPHPDTKIEEAKTIALNKIDVTSLGHPQTLSEFERHFYTFLSKPERLVEYLDALDLSEFAKLCKGATVEAAFLMSLVDNLPSLMKTDRFLAILNSLTLVSRFQILTKFLSRREKERIRNLVSDREELAELLTIFQLNQTWTDTSSQGEESSLTFAGSLLQRVQLTLQKQTHQIFPFYKIQLVSKEVFVLNDATCIFLDDISKAHELLLSSNHADPSQKQRPVAKNQAIDVLQAVWSTPTL